MEERLSFFLLRITTHDFLKYASRELGRTVVTSPYLHNTSLLYAINKFARIHRVAVGLVPEYDLDFRAIDTYVTPARIYDREEACISGNRMKIGFYPAKTVKITHNSVNTALQTTEMKRLVFPALLSYISFCPLTTFVTYGAGKRPPAVIRLGKKEPPARVLVEKLRDITVERGRFTPSHPVNPLDLPKDSKIIKSELYLMKPSPILLNVSMEGNYVKGIDSNGREHFIALPDQNRFEAIKLPSV